MTTTYIPVSTGQCSKQYFACGRIGNTFISFISYDLYVISECIY